MKSIGKLCEGELHAQFDERGSRGGSLGVSSDIGSKLNLFSTLLRG